MSTYPFPNARSANPIKAVAIKGTIINHSSGKIDLKSWHSFKRELNTLVISLENPSATIYHETKIKRDVCTENINFYLKFGWHRFGGDTTYKAMAGIGEDDMRSTRTLIDHVYEIDYTSALFVKIDDNYLTIRRTGTCPEPEDTESIKIFRE